jgi:hypothetical protein
MLQFFGVFQGLTKALPGYNPQSRFGLRRSAVVG